MILTPDRVKLSGMHYTTLIDVAGLARLIGKPGTAVLDCRFDLAAPQAGRMAYLQAHIPGAVYADLDLDLSGPVGPGTGRHPLPQREDLAARCGALGIDSETQVILYDQANGAFAARAWWLLRWLGHRCAAVLDGGLNAWRAAGLTVQAGDNAAAPRKFLVRPATVAIATTSAVVANLRDRTRLVIDARTPERFAGTVEPIDAVAGHVPEAVNHPFSANLGPEGRFLAQPELRRRWDAIRGVRQPEELIVMCGSGVTACHHLLALEIAGLGGAALYAGSWSEWIRDPERPVARDPDIRT